MEPTVPGPGTRRACDDRPASSGTRGAAVRGLVLVAALVVLVGLAAAAAAQWPQEGRTPTRNASAPTDGPPTSFVTGTDDAILWTANPGTQHGDGKERIEAAPVLHDNLVIVATEEGTVAAYGALAGQPVWHYDVPAGENQDEIRGTPAVVESNEDAIVVFGAQDGYVRALDLDDGTLEWRTDLSPSGGDWPVTAVHHRGNQVFVGTVESEVVALRIADGSIHWRTEASGLQDALQAGLASAETDDGEWIYVPTKSLELVRLRPGNGGKASQQVGGNLWGATAVRDDRFVLGIGGGDDGGRAKAYSAADAREEWDVHLTNDDVRSDALLLDDRVILGDEDGRIYSRDPADGGLQWETTLLSSADHSRAIRGQISEANGTLYVPSEDGLLFARDAATGEKEWTLNLGGGCEEAQLTCGLTGPVIWEEKLYTASEDGILWVVGPESAAGPQPPQAEATALERGLTVELDATGSTDPNMDSLTYEWDLGDGTTAAGPHLAYTYRQAGNYTVTLTVTDSTDRTDSLTLDVRAEAAPSTDWSGPGGDPGADRATPDDGPPSWTEAWERTFPAELASDPILGSWGVAAAGTDGTLRAYTLGGDHRWSRDLAGAEALARGNGTFFVAVRDRIQALDHAAGNEVGNVTADEALETLAVDGDLAAAGDGNGGVLVWNRTSDANWTAQHGTDQNPVRLRDGPVFGPDGDRVVVLTVTNNLHVYEADDGSLVYAKTQLGMEARHLSVDGTGIVLSGLSADVNSGELRGLDLATGTLRWSHSTGSEVLGHAAADGKVVAATAGDDVLAVDRDASVADDRELWRETLSASPRGSLAAAGEAVVVPTADGVRLLDPGNGTLDDSATLEAGARRGAVHETLAALQADAAPEQTPDLVVAGAVPWEANFTVTPARPEAGETVTFRDASLAPGGAARTFAFGDGNSTAAETATHAYAEAGNYSARLTVDAAGSAPKLVTLGDVEVVPVPTDGNGTDGDGNGTDPPDNGTDGGDGEPPTNGTDGDDGQDGEPPADGGDGDGGTPYRPDAAVPGPEAAAAVLVSVLAAVARRRRARR